MKILISTAITVGFLFTGATASAEPPKHTLEAFEHFLKTEDLSGSYLLWAKSDVSKPNGKKREVEETLVRITSDGADADSELISYKKNGVDKTAERRKEQEKQKKKREAEEEKKGKTGASKKRNKISLDLGLTLPTEEHRARYVFGPIKEETGLRVVDFEPAPGQKDLENMVKGRLAWHPDTLDPVFLEAEPVEMPKYVERLWMRTEFKRAAGKLMMVKNLTRGAGGLLLIKRKFKVEVEVRDYKPLPAAK